jgi:hypothetical protein
MAEFDAKQEAEEEYDITYETCPAKDPLKLETMDLIGVLMATVQELAKRIEILEKK